MPLFNNKSHSHIKLNQSRNHSTPAAAAALSHPSLITPGREMVVVGAQYYYSQQTKLVQLTTPPDIIIIMPLLSDDDDLPPKQEDEFRYLRRPQSSSSRKIYPRPLSLTRSSVGIISNPKLVKSLQDLNNQDKYRSGVYASVPRIDTTTTTEDQLKLPEDEPHCCRRWVGLLLSLVASLVLSLSSILVKAVMSSGEKYDPYSISVWTFQGILLPSLLILLIHKLKQNHTHTISPKKYLFLLVRASLGAGGTVLKVYSLRFMSAADSAVITFSTPVFVVIVAWLFLDEPCGVVPILTAILVLCGVGLILRPPWITGETHFDTQLLIGASLALGCMLFGTFAVVTLRYLKDVDYALITSVYGVVGTVVSLSLCYGVEGTFTWPASPTHWAFAAAVALLTFVGHITLTLALKFEAAGPVALVRTSEILFMFIWQVLFLNTLPTTLGVVGAVVVVLGVVIITLRKWVSTLPHSNKHRTSCSWILL